MEWRIERVYWARVQRRDGSRQSKLTARSFDSGVSVETQPIAEAGTATRSHTIWTPLLVIAMAELLIVFNITALKACVDGLAESFSTPVTNVKSVIVTYSIVVAALIMPGTRIGQAFGARRVFRAMVLLFGFAMLTMTIDSNSTTLLVTQIIAGVASALLIPALVMLIADHYRGDLHDKAVTWFSAVQAIGIVPALLFAGAISTRCCWPSRSGTTGAPRW